MGARVIKHAVAVLADEPEGKGLGLIQDVVLVGAPLDTSRETWDPLRRVAARGGGKGESKTGGGCSFIPAHAYHI